MFEMPREESFSREMQLRINAVENITESCPSDDDEHLHNASSGEKSTDCSFKAKVNNCDVRF